MMTLKAYAASKKDAVMKLDIPPEQKEDICKEIDNIVAAASHIPSVARAKIRSWIRWVTYG